VRERVDVADVYLTGYSLGAANAAWVARLDEGQQPSASGRPCC